MKYFLKCHGKTTKMLFFLVCFVCFLFRLLCLAYIFFSHERGAAGAAWRARRHQRRIQLTNKGLTKAPH